MGLELAYVGFLFLSFWAVAYIASGFGFIYAYKLYKTNFDKSLLIGFISLCVFVPTSIFLIKWIWPAHVNVTVDDRTTIDTIMSQEKAHCFKATGLENNYDCDGIIYYLTIHLADRTDFRFKAKMIGISTYPDTRKWKAINGIGKQVYTKEELIAYLKRKGEQMNGDFTDSIAPQEISDGILAWLSPKIKLGISHNECVIKPDYRLCLEASELGSGDYILQFEIS